MSDRDETFAPDERMPCLDEVCIGVLDSHGVCGTCGRAADPEALASTAPASDEATESDAEAEETTPAAEASAPARDEREPETDADERVPCGNDVCVGVLDSAGRCGTCGQSFAARG
jgi:hypothetical protein